MSEKNPRDFGAEDTSQITPQGADSTAQRDGVTLPRDEYQRAFARRRRTQWIALPIYFIAVIATILLVKVGPVDEERFWWIILVVMYGGLIPMLFSIYIYPLIRPVQAHSLPDGELVPPPTNLENPEGLQELNHIWILYKIAVTMWSIILAPFVYMAITGARFDYSPVQFLGVVISLHLFFTWWLGRITAEVNPTFIRVGMGPIKSKTPIAEIESIRSVAVRPLRDFLGWGWRVKGDGTVGWIADMKVGVEFTRKDGRRTVVSVRDPQRYVDYVRRIKADDLSSSVKGNEL